MDVRLPAIHVTRVRDVREHPLRARHVEALEASVERGQERAALRARRAVIEGEDPERVVADVRVGTAVVDRENRARDGERRRTLPRRGVRVERRDQRVARGRHAPHVARHHQEVLLRARSVVEEREERDVRLPHAARLGLSLDREEERGDVEDRSLRVRLRDHRADHGEGALVELALAMEVERRRDQRVRLARAVEVAIVALEEERSDPPVHVATGAVPEVGAHEGEGALLAPVRGGEEQRGVEVAAVLPCALEVERREPVVVLGRRLAVRERAEDEDAVLAIADAPRDREEDVGIHLR